MADPNSPYDYFTTFLETMNTPAPAIGGPGSLDGLLRTIVGNPKPSTVSDLLPLAGSSLDKLEAMLKPLESNGFVTRSDSVVEATRLGASLVAKQTGL